MSNRILGRSKSAAFAACMALVFLASPVLAQETTSTGEVAPVESAETDSAIRIPEGRGTYERALVVSVLPGSRETAVGTEQVELYGVRFLSGPLEGETREIESTVSNNPYGLKPQIGDKVVIFMQPGDEPGTWNLYLDSFDRRAALFWLFAVFFLTLVLLSGWQGVKVGISIVVSVMAIGFVLIPLFLRGVNPVPTAIILMGILTYLSTGFTTGWNRKSLVTALGTMGGALAGYLLSTIFVEWAHLSGLSTEEDRLFFRNNPELNPRGLLFAGIIIAAAGAAEDVAVSIASAASEVKRVHPRATFKEVFSSAMVVGKDHMGALANTLIFAYVGASLAVLLQYTQFEGSWLKFINFDSVVEEIIRSITGTIGITFTVPITALLATWAVLKTGPLSKKKQAGSHSGHTH